MSMFRRSIAAAIFVAVCVAVPAHARFGYTRVDTWVRYGDRVAGRNTDAPSTNTLAVWAPAGSTRKIAWVIYNAGNNIPKIHHATFQGCDDSSGFQFHYIRRDGKNVTWPVTHDGYRASVDPHERTRITIRVRSTARDRSYSCVLTGTGNGPSSTVKVWVHS